MILGTVTGHLWGARKSERLAGRRLVIVRPERVFRYAADHVVAVDTLGAEVGQRVIVCLGLPARRSLGDDRSPVDAAVAGIVDQIDEVAP